MSRRTYSPREVRYNTTNGLSVYCICTLVWYRNNTIAVGVSTRAGRKFEPVISSIVQKGHVDKIKKHF